MYERTLLSFLRRYKFSEMTTDKSDKKMKGTELMAVKKINIFPMYYYLKHHHRLAVFF